MENRPNPSSVSDDVKPLLKLSLVRRAIEHTLKEHASSNVASVKLTNDANALTRELVHAFVVEACNRAAAQHDLSGGRGEVTEEHLFHVLPQLLLDF